MMQVPFYDLSATSRESRDEVMAAISGVLDRSILVMGGELEAFESEFARYCGAEQAIGVGNGLEALSLALRALGVSPGDEVIVPSQTFVATWLAVSHVGAVPVSVDIDAQTFTLDHTKIQPAISSRTRAIIPVHLYGHPANMDEIRQIADANGLFVLEDAAQAHGASYKGRRTGVLGPIAAFSFYPTKNLGAYGDGGAIVTNDPKLATSARKLRNYGSEQKYVHEVIGYNSRLDELQAAILRVKLRNLDENNAARRRAAHYYSARLTNLKELQLPSEHANVEHVYHLYVVRHPRRDWLAGALAERGISTAIHYPTAPGRQIAYTKTHGDADTPVGIEASKTSLSLPLWPQINESQQDYVVEALREILACEDI